MAGVTVIRGGQKILGTLPDGTGDSIMTLDVTSKDVGTVATITTNPFADNTALVKNAADNTKLAIFSAASISPGTTRTYTLPNSNGTLALFSDITALNAGAWAVTGNTAITTPTITGDPFFAGTVLIGPIGSSGATGSLDIRGINGGNAFRVTNHTGGSAFFSITNAGAAAFTSLTSFAVTSAAAVAISGTTMSIASQGGGSDFGMTANGGGLSFAGGTTINAGFGARVTKTFNPTSGTNTHSGLEVLPTWNTTGSYSGIVRGIYYNSTNTALTGATHIALHTTSGQVFFANATADTITANTRADFRGISGGTILRLATDTNVTAVRFINTGVFEIGSAGNIAFSATANGAAQSISGDAFLFNALTFGDGLPNFNWAGTTITSTTGTRVMMGTVPAALSFAPTSGTATFNYFSARPTLNTTGTYVGTAIGYDWNPTLTSVTGMIHLAYRSTSGQILFAASGSDTVTASTRLDVRGISSGNVLRLASDANSALWTFNNTGTLAGNVTNGNAVTGINSIGFVSSAYSGSISMGNNFTFDSASPNDAIILRGSNGAPTAVISLRSSSVNAWFANTSGTLDVLKNSEEFRVSSGTATVHYFEGAPILNTTGTYSGTLVGYDWNPTLTSTTGMTHLAWRNTSGQVLINGATVTASTALDLRGINGGTVFRMANHSNTVLHLFDNTGSITYSHIGITGPHTSYSGTFAQSSGSASFTGIQLVHTYNTSGSYSGTARGIYYNPTLTSTTGLTHYSWDSTSGLMRVSQTDSGTNTVLECLRLERVTSGTAATGLGVQETHYLESTGGTSVEAAKIVTKWQNAGSQIPDTIFSTNTGVSIDIIKYNSSGVSLLGAVMVSNLSTLPTADRLFHVSYDNDNTGTEYVAKFTKTRTSTTGFVDNIGVGLEFEVETANTNKEIGGLIDVIVTDRTSTAENFAVVVKTMNAGAAATEKARIDHNGVVLSNVSGDAFKAGTLNGGGRNGVFLGLSNTAGLVGFRAENDTATGAHLYSGGSTASGTNFGVSRQNRVFLTADGSSNAGMAIGTITDDPVIIGANDTERIYITGTNVGFFGTQTFGSGSGIIGMTNAATNASASVANSILIHSKDSSVGTTNATLALYLEQAVEAIGTFTPSHKIRVWINGTEYWIQLDAV